MNVAPKETGHRDVDIEYGVILKSSIKQLVNIIHISTMLNRNTLYLFHTETEASELVIQF